MKLIDILRAESKWTKKQQRKKKKRQVISQNKWNKRWYRQYQSETGKNDLFELIPKGTPYCYKVYRPLNVEEKDYIQVVCPFHYFIEIPTEERINHIGIVAVGQNHIGGCKLLKKTDDDMGGSGLLWDSCKECYLNYGFGDFE
jgi:hypothetical protein